jgi:hypothetical protein
VSREYNPRTGRYEETRIVLRASFWVFWTVWMYVAWLLGWIEATSGPLWGEPVDWRALPVGCLAWALAAICVEILDYCRYGDRR